MKVGIQCQSGGTTVENRGHWGSKGIEIVFLLPISAEDRSQYSYICLYVFVDQYAICGNWTAPVIRKCTTHFLRWHAHRSTAMEVAPVVQRCRLQQHLN